MPIRRKVSTWVSKPHPGPHAVSESISLVTALRDVLGVAATAREAEKIVARGEVLVDGKIVRDARFPVGLMDVLGIPKIKKHYRVLVDSKARISLNEIRGEQAKFKLCKLLGKHTVKEGKTQLCLHDGRTMLSQEKIQTNSTLKISIPDGKILEFLKLEPGAKCLVVSGKHAGVVGELLSLVPGTATQDAEAKLKADGGEFLTVRKYLFVVGNLL